MNPASSVQQSKPASYPFNASGIAGAQLGASVSIDAQKRFVASINRAIGDDTALKEEDPSNGLTHQELTALRRERDRLAPLCTDDAGALALAVDLSAPVRRVLTDALCGVGLTVVDHQASQQPRVSFHLHATQMKRPPPDDGVVGPANDDEDDDEDNDDREVVGPDVAGAPAQAEGARRVGPGRDVKTDLADALAAGDAAGVTAVLDKLVRAGLCPQRIAEIVTGEDDSPGHVGLCLALLNGHAATVTAFLEGLKEAGLSPHQVAAIAAGQEGPENTPCLSGALGNGHAAAITALMDGLTGAGLSAQQVAQIAAAKIHGQHSTLVIALKSGHAAAVTAFVEGLKRAGLGPQQIAEIVTAKSSDALPGLASALREGHARAVTAFLEALTKAGLRPQQIADIVTAKFHDGHTGLHWALFNEHAAAVTAFMDGLAGAGLSGQQVANIVAEKDSRGCPGLFYALFGGRAAAVTELMTGLERAGLGPQQVAQIVEGVCLPRKLAPRADKKPAIADALEAYQRGLNRLQRRNLLSREYVAPITASLDRLIAGLRKA
ncbi:hypothetical protein GHT07_02915 [Caenimonas koreensis DSM 17982]|uniref:Ankyrin repeat n=1 Tax=Caenimonas koreensis DSM 17982 TaxID=1121255 RepID=A0A844AQ07_9BURK|nr:hypothetical protein [Caenimonas koreensis]MRD46215.1 hypothetical protein [Caenimonas koreensis DSM 17982]